MLSIASSLNPYNNQHFLGFFWQLFLRIIAFIGGDIAFTDIVSDEIQIIVLLGVSASAALVGTFLVLKRVTMLANSLSHTILLGIVIAYMLTGGGGWENGEINIQWLLLSALLMGFVTAFLTEFLTKTVKLQEDASTSLVFTSLFALGIIMVTLFTRDAHIGTEVVMGNVDALHLEDCKMVGIILAVNIIIFTLFFKEFMLTVFDPALARALGFSTLFFNYLLLTQVSLTVVGAFRAVGVLMVLAFITGPPLTARMLTHNLKKMLVLAVCLGAVASIVGVALSRHLLTVYQMPLSTGGLVVCVIVLLYLSILLFTKCIQKPIFEVIPQKDLL